MTPRIEDVRIRPLNRRECSGDGRYVLYWMQQSQRAHWNPALTHAIEQANELALPVIVGFGLMPNYPEANARHYAFMLEGLRQTEAALAKLRIPLILLPASPADAALQLSQDAALVVCDRGYLRHPLQWRKHVAERCKTSVIQVEGDVVVPTDLVSDHAEWAARTIRPKLKRLWTRYLKPFHELEPEHSGLRLKLPQGFDLSRPIARLLSDLGVDSSVEPAPGVEGGTEQALQRLERFLKRGLPGYAERRSDPSLDHVSRLSAYLHFGQISPVEIAWRARECELASKEDLDAFFNELIVQRELAINFVLHTPRYDSYEALPEWSRKTLAKHEHDHRPRCYDLKELESATTGDRYWNAAMQEMIATGYTHNTMRMYWGKKILEWSPTPGDAFVRALYLNNTYFIDGRDPSAYANVAWCFGLHDRPWPERPVYGTVRTMKESGLLRKYDMETYVQTATRY